MNLFCISLFYNPKQFKSYIYGETACDAYYECYEKMGRIPMAVMLQNKPFGEIMLKVIDWDRKCCTMGITIVNDS